MTPPIYPKDVKPYAGNPTAYLLQNIQFQIDTIKISGHKPAVVRVHADTHKAIQEYLGLQGHELYGLQVVVDPCMKPGTARVFQEWK